MKIKIGLLYFQNAEERKNLKVYRRLYQYKSALICFGPPNGIDFIDFQVGNSEYKDDDFSKVTAIPGCHVTLLCVNNKIQDEYILRVIRDDLAVVSISDCNSLREMSKSSLDKFLIRMALGGWIIYNVNKKIVLDWNLYSSATHGGVLDFSDDTQDISKFFFEPKIGKAEDYLRKSEHVTEFELDHLNKEIQRLKVGRWYKYYLYINTNWQKKIWPVVAGFFALLSAILKVYYSSK